MIRYVLCNKSLIIWCLKYFGNPFKFMNMGEMQKKYSENLNIWRKESLKKFFYEMHRPLCFFATRFIKDIDTVEDIVQDAFISLLKQDNLDFPNKEAVCTYLYSSVKNNCLNFIRSVERKERSYEGIAYTLEENDNTFLLQQIESEIIAELFEAVDELPERCKEIFRMSYLYGKEEKQVAELLGISVNTVKTQKLRAKSYLRGRLGDLFIYIPLFLQNF